MTLELSQVVEAVGLTAPPGPDREPMRSDIGGLLLIDFAAGGNSAGYRTHGWSGQETAHVWTVGSRSGLCLPASFETQPLILELDVGPCAPVAPIRGQLLRIILNGRPLGWHRLTQLTRLRLQIDPELFRLREGMTFAFEHPCFVRLDLAGYRAEARPLAVAFYALRLCSLGLFDRSQQITKQYAPKLGHTIPSGVLPPTDPPAAPYQHRYRFGAEGDSNERLSAGWVDDDDGNKWSDGKVARLELPVPPDPGAYELQLRLEPMTIRQIQALQRCTLLLNGCVVGQFRLTAPTVLTIPVAPELLIGADALVLEFGLPDSIPQAKAGGGGEGRSFGILLDEVTVSWTGEATFLRSDELEPAQPQATSARFLGESIEALPAAVETALGVKLPDMLLDFESLGDNCAFGLAQRKGGTEVLNLLRFANTPLANFIRGMRDEFKAATDPAQTILHLHDDGVPREYMLSIKRYGIRWHTLVHETNSEADTIFKEQTTKLAYLRRRFYEGLRAGRKIYNITRMEPRKIRVILPIPGSPRFQEMAPEPLRLAEAMSVHRELNRYGRNTLLFLVPSQKARPSGTVELLAPGLMRGYLGANHITPDVDIADHTEWLRVVANAWILQREQKQARTG